ncbi:hypothetical protein [Burkholderia ambifaria]|uniref:hypothetical protein n=1 Tax=Burkholderia ambifaria TaxID=152480 RepID=UPI003CC9AAB5
MTEINAASHRARWASWRAFGGRDRKLRSAAEAVCATGSGGQRRGNCRPGDRQVHLIDAAAVFDRCRRDFTNVDVGDASAEPSWIVANRCDDLLRDLARQPKAAANRDRDQTNGLQQVALGRVAIRECPCDRDFALMRIGCVRIGLVNQLREQRTAAVVDIGCRIFALAGLRRADDIQRDGPGRTARGQSRGPSGDQNVVRNPAITLRPPCGAKPRTTEVA